jgi:hypothetical protein
MDKKFISRCKKIDWQKVIDICQSLTDLNDGQYRFLKGRFIELLIEKESNGLLKYVGDKHKDFVCNKFCYSVELKSVTSQQLYKKDSTLRHGNSIILNNSMGSNKKLFLDPNDVADYLLILKSDGAVLVDKKTVLQNAQSNGDGFVLKLKPNNVIELSGYLTQVNKYSTELKSKFDDLLRATIHELGDTNV